MIVKNSEDNLIDINYAEAIEMYIGEIQNVIFSKIQSQHQNSLQDEEVIKILKETIELSLREGIKISTKSLEVIDNYLLNKSK
ncbi:MAG: hypothetical protein N4A40_12630 [Tissierellales bacterium]|nr:hypothetical protein [Tissierellales bacterium]